MKNTLLAAALTAAALTAANTPGWENLAPERTPPKPVKLLWQEGFEGKISDFVIEYRDGATGRVTLVASPKRSGKQALSIVKTNAPGYILVRSRKTLKSAPKTALQTSVFVHCADANPEYALGFLRLYGKKEDLTYCAKLDKRGGGGPKMKVLVNTPPNVWERKLAHFPTDKNTEVHAAIVVAGPPSTSSWDDWTIEDYDAAQAAWNRRFARIAARPKTVELQDLRTFRAALAAEPEHTGAIVSRDGSPKFVIDGKVALPVLYKGTVGGKGQSTFHGELLEPEGVTLHSILLRLGDSPRRKGFWRGRNDLDAGGAIQAVETIMRTAPGSKFLLEIGFDAYQKFCDDFPEETWRLGNGRKVYGHHVHAMFNVESEKPDRYWYWPSMSSRVLRDEFAKCIEKLVAELKRTGLSKRIVGVHIAGFHDGQFSTRKLDYSAPAVAGFREFLREKYRTSDALRRAWRNEKVDFATAEAPKFGSQAYLDPERDAAQADFLYYQKTAPFRLQEFLARKLRRSFGKPIVISRYCQAPYSGTFVGAYDIGAFLNSKEIDMLSAQPSYARRAPGLACGLRLPLASFAAHNKIFMHEFDLRTYAGLAGNETELRALGLSQAEDDPMWRTIHRKMAGQMIAARAGWWYLDMAAPWGGWFSTPGIISDIGEVYRTARDFYRAPSTKFQADAALVIDEAGLLLCNLGAHYYNYSESYLLPEQLHLFAISGVPHDILLLEDFMKKPELARKYKMLIFAGMTRVDAPRLALLDKLRGDRRTLVFLAGTGRLGEAEKATGFIPEHQAAPADHTVLPAKGVRWNVASRQTAELMASSLGAKPPAFRLPERFSVRETPGVRVTARYQTDGAAAMAERDFGSYRTVYVGEAGGVTPEYLHELARRCGAFTATDRSGLQVDMNGDFLSLHGVIPGRYRIRLPYRGSAVNLKTGRTVVRNATEFELNAGSAATYWFRLRPAKTGGQN